jgi:hypothetical protein
MAQTIRTTNLYAKDHKSRPRKGLLNVNYLSSEFDTYSHFLTMPYAFGEDGFKDNDPKI